jgi:hypothetical protein
MPEAKARTPNKEKLKQKLLWKESKTEKNF